jgi:hypothetical protein
MEAQVFRMFESLWFKASRNLKACVTKDGEGSLYRVTFQHSEHQVQIKVQYFSCMNSNMNSVR